MVTNQKTPEQEARDLLERLSDCAQYTDPQAMSSGDIVELANLIAEVRRLRRAVEPTREPVTSASRCTGCGELLADGQPFTSRTVEVDGVCRLECWHVVCRPERYTGYLNLDGQEFPKGNLFYSSYGLPVFPSSPGWVCTRCGSHPCMCAVNRRGDDK